jgi:hypothetical protein
MSATEPKLLRFPNGFQMTSDQIDRVHVYPDISPSRNIPYVRVFDRLGLVYEGLVDLDDLEACEDGPAASGARTRQHADARRS